MSCERKSGEREIEKKQRQSQSQHNSLNYFFIYTSLYHFGWRCFLHLVFCHSFEQCFAQSRWLRAWMNCFFFFLFIQIVTFSIELLCLCVCVFCGVCYKAPGLMKIWSISTPNVSWICVAPEHCGEHPFVSSDWP